MMSHLQPITLSPEQEGQIFGVLSVGCDRETAANIVGRTLAEIATAMRDDPEFAKAVRRTEALVEMNLMRTVHEAAKDPKNWKAAVWWLAVRSPERFVSRGPDTVTSRQLKAFIALIEHNIIEDIRDEDDRSRIQKRLAEIQNFAHSVRDPLWSPGVDEDEDGPLEDRTEGVTSTTFDLDAFED